jgi:hypothetical protein
VELSDALTLLRENAARVRTASIETLGGRLSRAALSTVAFQPPEPEDAKPDE